MTLGDCLKTWDGKNVFKIIKMFVSTIIWIFLGKIIFTIFVTALVVCNQPFLVMSSHVAPVR